MKKYQIKLQNKNIQRINNIKKSINDSNMILNYLIL